MDEKPKHASDEEFAARILAEHELQAQAQCLTAAELLEVRELLESRKRWEWLRSGLKAGAIWIAAIVAGATVGLEALKAAVKALGR